MLDTLELVHDGRTAVCYATQEMFEQTHAIKADTEEIIERLLSMKVVEIVVVLREENSEYVKGSLRAKNSIDVNEVAHHLGGGGHTSASGFNAKGTLDDIKNKLLTLLQGYYE
jgi:phosphoesterase RecJ-like protein